MDVEPSAAAVESQTISGVEVAPLETFVPEPEQGHQPRRSGRSNRGVLPARYRQQLPEGPSAQPAAPEKPSAAEKQVEEAPELVLPEVYRTKPNRFGVYREYLGKPTRIPDAYAVVEDLLERQPPVEPGSVDSSAAVPGAANDTGSADLERGKYWPYPNFSTFVYDRHFWKDHRGNKSMTDEKELAEVINMPGFRNEDVLGQNWDRYHKLLDEMKPTPENFKYGPGWYERLLPIDIPLGRKWGNQTYNVAGFHYRKPVELVRDIVENDPASERFYWEPFKVFKLPAAPNAEPERIFEGPYTADFWMDAYKALLLQAREPDCKLDRALCFLSLWSDATQAAQFGTAKLWPGYAMISNQSNYEKCSPSSGACHHFAHFPDLPDSLQDKIRQWTGKAASKPLLTHCKREVMHAALKVLFADPEFLHAYQHGIVVRCRDGVKRRIYLRILTYSADYPEKVLIATIRDLGGCPCPRCLMPLVKVSNMGMKSDIAFRLRHPRVDTPQRQFDIKNVRQLIKNGWSIKSKKVEGILKPHSYVPTENAFSCLQPFGFNLFQMLVIDLMHEFELGVWKALLLHLMRILFSLPNDKVALFNERFRQMPTFARDTIRKFANNVADLKKLAARDYEDILQCIIPVIEGLLPEPHNSTVLDLLFTCALWHGLAKLRLHSETTLKLLRETTTLLGQRIRKFAAETCPAFSTRETPREAQARQKRKQSAATRKGKGREIAEESDGRREKTFNGSTVKLHFLADTESQIRQFGTTDGLSTQPGELAHVESKGYFDRGSKNEYVKQVTKLERRSHRLQRISQLTKTELISKARKRRQEQYAEEILAYSKPSAPYHIAQNSRKHDLIGTWETTRLPDRAKKDFTQRLRQHLVARLLKRDLYDPNNTLSEDDLSPLRILKNRIYWHAAFRPLYTTYNIRRAQDSINPRTSHCDIMVPSTEDPNDLHPYWYARVIRVAHVNVVYAPADVRDGLRMDVLFVRWFGRDTRWKAGWNASRLDRLSFIPDEDSDAFGFVDPSQVIRACHLSPCFAEGKTTDWLPGRTIARKGYDDWKYYYVMRFVDRDMLMRYIGGAPGHPDIYRRTAEDDMPSADEDVIAEPSPIPTRAPTPEAPPLEQQPAPADGHSRRGLGLSENALGAEERASGGTPADDAEDEDDEEGEGDDDDDEEQEEEVLDWEGDEDDEDDIRLDGADDSDDEEELAELMDGDDDYDDTQRNTDYILHAGRRLPRESAQTATEVGL